MKSLQIDQPQLLEMLIKASPSRRSKGPLTAPTQMLFQPAAHIPIHRTLCLTRIAKGKVVGPAPQLSVDSYYQMRHRYMAMASTDRLSKRFALRLQCLRRRGDIQVSKIATFKIPLVSECETRSQFGLSWFHIQILAGS